MYTANGDKLVVFTRCESLRPFATFAVKNYRKTQRAQSTTANQNGNLPSFMVYKELSVNNSVISTNGRNLTEPMESQFPALLVW